MPGEWSPFIKKEETGGRGRRGSVGEEEGAGEGTQTLPLDMPCSRWYKT